MPLKETHSKRCKQWNETMHTGKSYLFCDDKCKTNVKLVMVNIPNCTKECEKINYECNHEKYINN